MPAHPTHGDRTALVRLRRAQRFLPQGAQRFLLAPSAKDTELIAFGICHDNPRSATLADVDTLRAMSLKASHLGVLVIRPEVEMRPALGLLALIEPDEFQPRQAIRLRAGP
jgi:hypothetical protein